MRAALLATCVIVGAGLGAIAGSGDRDGRAASEVAVARSARLRDEVDRLRVRFADVKRDLDAAATPAAATAARAKLFQLRVDMVALEDELAALASRRPVARDL